MNLELIRNWNKTITNEDTVYFLGDFGLGPKHLLKRILESLNRKKIILVKGNHDKSEKSMLEMGFDEVHKYMDINIEKVKILLSHVPIFSIYHDINISGHSHNTFRTNGNILNVSVENWGYTPLSWTQIKQMFLDGKLDKKKFKTMEIKITGD